MILDEDIVVLKDTKQLIKKNLKKDLKHWVKWFISVKTYYPNNITFVEINTNKKFSVETTRELLNKINSKSWITNSLASHGIVITNKIAAQLIIDDLFSNVSNYLEENNLNYYDYKMSYKDIYWK